MNENLNTNLEEGQVPQSDGVAVNSDPTTAESSSLQPATNEYEPSNVDGASSSVLPQEVKANSTDGLDNPPVAPQEKSR